MAQEYIALKENNDVGVIALSTAAFQAIAKNVIDEEEMTKLGMNAYLAVSRGSQNPAYMSILHFNNAPDKNAK